VDWAQVCDVQLPKDEKTVVKLETWLDSDNDKDFVKIYERIESGGWTEMMVTDVEGLLLR
jgi:hypothetical protein